MTPLDETGTPTPRICIVGSGTKFLSGISYYTYFLAKSLNVTFDTSVILMRSLVPRFLYPGAARVGADITDLSTASLVPTFDGVDWYSPLSVVKASRFLDAQEPDIVVFQWWTGAVLPAFLYLTRRALSRGAKVVIEFHEDQDTGESSLPLIERIVRPGLRHLIRSASAYVVHSQWDAKRLSDRLQLDPDRIFVIYHGPYPLAGGPFEAGDAATSNREGDSELGNGRSRDSDTDAGVDVTVLFFGTIRPYKGLEDLVDAFELLPRGLGVRWHLLVVGETWEGWDLPAQKISDSHHRGDIEFINRYVTDKELRQYFARADVVALPYTRSSASGPLHITMQTGLPVVITDVGGLTEAAGSYSGTHFVPPSDPAAIARALTTAVDSLGEAHADTHSWDTTRQAFEDLAANLAQSHGGPPS